MAAKREIRDPYLWESLISIVGLIASSSLTGIVSNMILCVQYIPS